ncbi:MAG: RidA family protein [Candidatus Lokiarchaeota archaeon]|nr:RidA family protein [Candidatus Lokiarchaeota archaeon]
MVKIKFVDTGGFKGGPYSPGLLVDNLVFVSGQGPLDAETKKMGTSIEEQTLTALNNVKGLVLASGAKISGIVKTTVFLKNIKDYAAMNQTYKEFFENNGVKDRFPTRTTVEVSNLPIDGMLIEIDCIAIKTD